MPTLEEVYKELKQVYDPEIPVNIVDLGLIYDVKLQDDTGVCNITMTLTSQACPEARTIPDVMKRRVNSIPGVKGTEIQIVCDEHDGAAHLFGAQASGRRGRRARRGGGASRHSAARRVGEDGLG